MIQELSVEGIEIPQSDQVEFSRLPQDVRQDLLALLEVVQTVHLAPARHAACKALAEAHAHRRGFTAASLLRKYYSFIASGGDWRSLLDRARAGADWWLATRERAPLPPDFIDYWKGLCERNQRKCRPAWSELIRQWKEWRAGDRAQALPGYTTCPEPDPATDRPAGWSYANLMQHKPSKFELVAARNGPRAAAPYRPLVFTSRVGLDVGQYYLFDDVMHDFKVNIAGQRHAQRLIQLHGIDLFSGCSLARGLKPMIENEVTGSREYFKKGEMLFLVAHILSSIGYRSDGTVLIVEHGTAALSAEVEEALRTATRGKVTVERSGFERSAAFAGMYDGRGKGNFRFKAAIESYHNLLHNETADTLVFPGQTGANSRVNPPEEMHPDTGGREWHNTRLLAALQTLPLERARQLRLPFLEFTEAVWLVNTVSEFIDKREEHRLEGWLEAGLMQKEFRLSEDMPWLPLERLHDLPDDQRRAIEALITGGGRADADKNSSSAPIRAIRGQSLIRTRRMSPHEVFSTRRRHLSKLPAPTLALLLGPKRNREVTARAGAFEVQDQELNPSPIRYEARRWSGNGPAQAVQDGEKFAAVINPFNIEEIHLFDARGGWMGVCPRTVAPSRADVEAVHRAMGAAKKAEAELLGPLARRGLAMTRKRLEDAKQNAKVLSGAPLTTEERDYAKELDALAESACLKAAKH